MPAKLISTYEIEVPGSHVTDGAAWGFSLTIPAHDDAVVLRGLLGRDKGKLDIIQKLMSDPEAKKAIMEAGDSDVATLMNSAKMRAIIVEKFADDFKLDEQAIEKMMMPYLGAPNGFDVSISWADLKRASSEYYYGVVVEAARLLYDLTFGATIETKVKNSSSPSA